MKLLKTAVPHNKAHCLFLCQCSRQYRHTVSSARANPPSPFSKILHPVKFNEAHFLFMELAALCISIQRQFSLNLHSSVRLWLCLCQIKSCTFISFQLFYPTSVEKVLMTERGLLLNYRNLFSYFVRQGSLQWFDPTWPQDRYQRGCDHEERIGGQLEGCDHLQ